MCFASYASESNIEFKQEIDGWLRLAYFENFIINILIVCIFNGTAVWWKIYKSVSLPTASLI